MGKKTSETARITISDKSVGLWHLQLSETQDWIAHLARTEEPDAFEIICRYHYKGYNSWYALKFNGNTDDAVEKARAIATGLAKSSQGHLEEFLVKDGDTDAFLMDIMSTPWADMKRAGNA